MMVGDASNVLSFSSKYPQFSGTHSPKFNFGFNAFHTVLISGTMMVLTSRNRIVLNNLCHSFFSYSRVLM